jgi:hypothetical protein
MGSRVAVACGHPDRGADPNRDPVRPSTNPQGRLGHADIAMTLHRYSHVTPDMQCSGQLATHDSVDLR